MSLLFLPSIEGFRLVTVRDGMSTEEWYLEEHGRWWLESHRVSPASADVVAATLYDLHGTRVDGWARSGTAAS